MFMHHVVAVSVGRPLSYEYKKDGHFVEHGDEITLVSLVCEDLGQTDSVVDVMRSVGPTVVLTPLLDGPQLNSRWAARYASMLAGDPGSAVLTLTSFGMVRRSRPHGRDSSPVVALWKDPVRGLREIRLETGSQTFSSPFAGIVRHGAAPMAAAPSTMRLNISMWPSIRCAPATQARGYRIPSSKC
jgi:hypothetical protein